MKLHDIQEIYDYNAWANKRILDTAEKVTPEQFTAPSSHAWGGLHGTLVHMLDTEWSWRNTLEGREWPPEMKPEDLPTLAAIRTRWAEEEQAMRAYLDGLRDEDMTGIVSYYTDSGALRERVRWHCLYHIVNHGMQHRSEAAHLLTNYGHSPGDIDFTVYLNEKAAARQP